MRDKLRIFLDFAYIGALWPLQNRFVFPEFSSTSPQIHNDCMAHQAILPTQCLVDWQVQVLLEKFDTNLSPFFATLTLLLHYWGP